MRNEVGEKRLVRKSGMAFITIAAVFVLEVPTALHVIRPHRKHDQHLLSHCIYSSILHFNVSCFIFFHFIRLVSRVLPELFPLPCKNMQLRNE